MRKIPLFLAVLLLTFSVTLHAIDWDSKSFNLIHVPDLVEKSRDVTTQSYPEADYVLMDSRTVVRYQADGTYLQVDDSAYKLLTDRAVISNRVVRSYYNQNYSRAKVPVVELVHADGSRTPMDIQGTMTDVVDSSSIAENIYDNKDRVITIPVIGAKPGDILRVIMVDEITKPRVPNTFSYAKYFESSIPIIHSSLVINAPADLPLKKTLVASKIGNGPTEKVINRGNRIVYSWSVENVPQYFPEPRMPGASTRTQRLLVSTFQDWQEVSRWYSNLCAPRLKTDDAIKKQVAELIKGTDDRQERIRRIFDFVSQKIRYMGVIAEDTAPGYEPHDVTMTFQQRAGVCRDKAALLAVMLEEAGIPAVPVLIHTESKKDPQVPMVWFNHAITAVCNPDGTYQLMDSTAQHTRDLLPAYLSDKSYLPATTKGEELLTTPTAPAPDNSLEISTTAGLDENGVITLRSVIHCNGINDNAYRQALLYSTPEERRLMVQEWLNGGTLQHFSFEPADPADTTQPLKLHLVASYPNCLLEGTQEPVAPEQTQRYLLNIPSLADCFGLYQSILKRATLSKRRFDYKSSFSASVKEELALTLPHGYSVKNLPQKFEHSSNGVEYHREFIASGRRVDLLQQVALSNLIYTPEEYAGLRQVKAMRDQAQRQLVILERQGQEATPNAPAPEQKEAATDGKYLRYVVSTEITGSGSYVSEHESEVQILTQSGLESHSDLQLPYTEGVTTIEVLSASVETNGKVTQVPKELIHVMDSPGEGSTPRYYTHKILAVNFPDLQIGSIIRTHIRYTTNGLPMVSVSRPILSTYPIQHYSYQLTIPADSGMEPQLLNAKPDPDYLPPGFVIPDIHSRRDKLNDGRIKYSWLVNDLPALPNEPDTPPDELYLPTIKASSGNWKEYSQVIQRLLKELGDGGKTVAAIAEMCRRRTPQDTLFAVREWMDKQIRKAGAFDAATPFSQLTPPEITLRDGYGHTADRAILIMALLKHLGFKSPKLYLGGSGINYPELMGNAVKFPIGELFSQWLVNVSEKESGADCEVWLNDQNRYAQFGTCSQDKTMVLSIDKGQCGVLRLPELYSDVTNLIARSKILPDGSAEYTLINNYSGTSFGIQRKRYAEMLPDQRKKHQDSMVTGISSDAVAADELATDFSKYPGMTQITVRIPNFLVKHDDWAYLPLAPEVKRASNYDPQRKLPMFFSSHGTVINEMRIQLPLAWRRVARMPKDHNYRLPGGAGSVSWQCRYVDSPLPTVVITIKRTSLPALLTAKQVQELRELREKNHGLEVDFLLLKPEL